MTTNPRYSQYGGASSPNRATGVYTGKITLIYDDGRVRVFINTFGRNMGPCRIINKSAGDAISLNDEVLCTYANDTSDELIVVGRLTERVDPVSESTSGLVVEASTTSALVRITQKGAGAALLVEDTTNPDSTPFIIDTSGNVGIGVSSPTAKIDVSGAAVISGDLTVDTTTFKVDSSNNRVGIGTSSPTTTLDVSGTVTATAFAGSPTAATTTTGASGVGYMGIPRTSTAGTTGDYTIVAADAGTHIYSTGARIITIPTNATLAMPIGSTIVFVNNSGGSVTIRVASTGGTDFLYLAGFGTTGDRTLGSWGIATAVKFTTLGWIISGNGLT